MATQSAISRVAVIGGSGFLGSAITSRLAEAGHGVRVLVRHPERLSADLGSNASTQIQPSCVDIRDDGALALALTDCDAVINAVGLYVERGAESFEAIHEQGALNVAHQCLALGIKRLLHLSGIGADPLSPSRYVRARARGEAMVRAAFPQATILRPSAVFDPADRFINALADIARVAPAIPLFGEGETRLQTVYRGDVAEAVLRALQKPEARGATYELGGPRVYSYRGLLELIMESSGRQRRLLPLPFAIWDGLAAVAGALPKPPLTAAQVTLMKRDNVVGADALKLQSLSIEPTPLEAVLPRYGFAKQGRQAGSMDSLTGQP